MISRVIQSLLSLFPASLVTFFMLVYDQICSNQAHDLLLSNCWAPNCREERKIQESQWAKAPPLLTILNFSISSLNNSIPLDKGRIELSSGLIPSSFYFSFVYFHRFSLGFNTSESFVILLICYSIILPSKIFYKRGTIRKYHSVNPSKYASNNFF